MKQPPVPCNRSTLTAPSSSPRPGTAEAGRDNTSGVAAAMAAPFSRCRATHHGFYGSLPTLIIRASGTAFRLTAVAPSVSREAAQRWSRSMQGAHQSCTSVTGCTRGGGGRHWRRLPLFQHRCCIPLFPQCPERQCMGTVTGRDWLLPGLRCGLGRSCPGTA